MAALAPRLSPSHARVGLFLSLDGTLQRIHHALRKQVRQRAGKRAAPPAVILDSQSVKTTEKGGTVDRMRASVSTVASVISLWTHSD
jgi:transposase